MNSIVLQSFSLAVILLLLTPVAANATEEAPLAVAISWENPDEYRDIKQGKEGKNRFRKRVYFAIEEHMNKLAEKFPEGYTLKMTVTDVDLAGRVRGFERVLFGEYPPVFVLSWALRDTDGNLVQEETNFTLRGGTFRKIGMKKYRYGILPYERALLESWFTRTFREYTR